MGLARHMPVGFKQGDAWLAPPCGTASRAREIPLSWAMKMAGAPEPVQLRSEAFPSGIPGLKGLDATKEATANAVYNTCAAIVHQAIALKKLFAVENPSRSYL